MSWSSWWGRGGAPGDVVNSERGVEEGRKGGREEESGEREDDVFGAAATSIYGMQLAEVAVASMGLIFHWSVE